MIARWGTESTVAKDVSRHPVVPPSCLGSSIGKVPAATFRVPTHGYHSCA